MKTLFINRKSLRCGVADYGKRVYAILKKSFDIDYKEVSSPEELTAEGYELVIINYHFSTLPWITEEHFKGLKTIAIFHEGPLMISPDAVIDADSTTVERGNYFSSPRPLFEGIEFTESKNDHPVIGSFGFGFADKNYSRIAELVCREFDKATIRLHIPFAEFGDHDGKIARAEVEKLKHVLNEHCSESQQQISLEVSHDFMDHATLLNWLHSNDINLFTYNRNEGRGLSSTIDYALSVRRPISVTMSVMFRHLPASVCIENATLKQLIAEGIKPLQEVYKQHTNEMLIEKYRQVIAFVA